MANQSQKPTRDECLDALSQLWHRCVAPQASDVIDQFDRSDPNWHLKTMEIGKHMPDKERETLLGIRAWKQCRELLKRSNRI